MLCLGHFRQHLSAGHLVARNKAMGSFKKLKSKAAKQIKILLGRVLNKGFEKKTQELFIALNGFRQGWVAFSLGPLSALLREPPN